MRVVQENAAYNENSSAIGASLVFVELVAKEQSQPTALNEDRSAV